ncbi:MAG TPA: alkaline phosphatase family protein [Candidatus Baltobacteraceae bacterium]|nr:alkaline phosphatase family protein [Candidatus Baltobacteraceae bacterium]
MLRRIVASIGCAALFSACSGNVTPPTSGFSNPNAVLARLNAAKPATVNPIQHIIVVIQENRTTDNLFNGFPGADTVTKGLNHKNLPVTLQPQGLEWEFDPSHSHPSLATEYNNGQMNGFDLDKCDLDPLNLTGGCTPPKNFAYSFVPQAEAQWLWLLAGQYAAVGKGYGFADHMFSSRQVPSFPGHQFLVAGQTPAAGDPWGPGEQGLDAIWGCDANPKAKVSEFGKTYNAPLKNGHPCYDYHSIADLLDDGGISWRYYTGAIGTNDGTISAFDAVRRVRYGGDWNYVITPMTNILSDIQFGRLPQVSFVTPPFAASDHGGTLAAGGPAWVMTLYVALTENRALYDSTTMLVTWDDSGGWYDHVKPPKDKFGPLGFRVPLIAISPYARQKVSHKTHTFGSILHFIEANWNLGSLHVTDEGSDDLSDMFDYNQTPIPPLANFGSFNRTAFERKYSPAYWQRLANDKRRVDTDQ